MRDTLAIVGSHPRGKETFDFSRTDCDIWVFNEALTVQSSWITRADAVFQMHLEPIWRNPNNRNDPKHYEWLKSGNTPTVYMQDIYRDVPKSERYPLDEIKRELLHRFEWTSKNSKGDHYFSSTFCYALALGIYQGYQTIECHGVEMETDTEYRYQRDGVTFWMGLALGRGVQVKAFCNIFDFPLYGYEGEATLHLEDFEKRMAEVKPQLEKAKADYMEVQRQSNEAVSDFVADFKNPERVVEALKAQVKAAYETNVLGGIYQENERYYSKAVAMKDEAGSFQFSRQEFDAALSGHGVEYNRHLDLANAASGACNAIFNEARLMKNQQRRIAKMRSFVDAAKKYLQYSMMLGIHQGAAMENQNYLAKLDNLIKAAGGAKSEAVLLERANVEISA